MKWWVKLGFLPSYQKWLSKQISFTCSHLKGPMLYPFSGVDFSSRTPVEQPCMISSPQTLKMTKYIHFFHLHLALFPPRYHMLWDNVFVTRTRWPQDGFRRWNKPQAEGVRPNVAEASEFLMRPPKTFSKLMFSHTQSKKRASWKVKSGLSSTVVISQADWKYEFSH